MWNTDEALAGLRLAGLRLTPQRRAVVEALSGDRSHPSAEDVSSRVASSLPGVSLSTVYKTLHEFARAGLLVEVDAGGALRFDPETRPHAHFVCDRCGLVSDVEIDEEISRELARLAGTDSVTVKLGGACSACARA